MNSRYLFLKENPPLPPISACISNLKKQVHQMNSYHNSHSDIDRGPSLQLLKYMIEDMKVQMNDLHLNEMDGYDEDLNEDRNDFIKRQVMDAKKWLEHDINELGGKQSSSAEINPQEMSINSNKQPNPFPNVDESNVRWRNNLLGSENSTSAHIVAYDNEAQKDGLERIQAAPNPFAISDVERMINSLQKRYGNNSSNNNTALLNNETSHPSTPATKVTVKSTPNSRRRSIQSRKSRSSSAKKDSLRKSPKSSQKNEIASSPHVNQYENIARPVSRQSSRPTPLNNNFVTEEVKLDPFELAPESRTTLPKPTEHSPPVTPKKYLNFEEGISVPPSPVEKESLRKIRPPTRKKGPPTALDLETPIPVVQFDGNSDCKENSAQTDYFHIEQNDSSQITQIESQSSGFVKTPTELLRRPIRNKTYITEENSSVEPLSVASNPDLYQQQYIQLSSIKKEQSSQSTVPNDTYPRISNAIFNESSHHRSPIRVPSPNLTTQLDEKDLQKSTPKRRPGNAGLELAVPIDTPNSRRNSEGTISTVEILSQNPFSHENHDENIQNSNAKRRNSAPSRPKKRKSRSKSVSKTKSRLEDFITSSIHPNHQENIKELGLKKSKKQKTFHHKKARGQKVKINPPNFPSLEDAPPLPDYVQSPLKHSNMDTLQNLVSLTDRLNKGKNTRKLMKLLKEVNTLHQMYHEEEVEY